MKLSFISASTIACLLGFSAIGQKGGPEVKNLKNINPNAIKATMTFLADDLVEGRQPGTRGFAVASKFVETQMMRIGLKPAMPDGGYIQPVPLKKGIVSEKLTAMTLGEETLTYGQEFIASPYMPQSESSVSAPLVFVGYGISAPEMQYDDYKGIDVKGKIVVFFNAAPESFLSNQRAYFTTNPVKYNEAIKRGAVGVIAVNFPNDKRSTWEATVRRTKQGTFKWLNKERQPNDAFPVLKAVATFNPDKAEKLFAKSGKTFASAVESTKAGKAESFDLNIQANIKVNTQFTSVAGSNLVGIIEGSDPKLKDEYIVYTAHLDHFGIGAPVKGDSIYNGAHDNASGVAILLEIAQTFKNLQEAPKRSIVFTIVTGEEFGLLGSDYFASNSPLNGKIVADLAIDMPFFFHPVLDIVPYGAQHSSLNQQVEKTAKILGLGISPDPFPEQVVFIRSDHFSFIKKGIPSLFIKSGFKTIPSDTIDRSKSDVGWRSSIYHTPQDDMSQPFDFDAAATHVKVNYLIGYYVAQDSKSPDWNVGDFFGGKFGKK
ncbi:M28 family metallopeptidase [Flectobacillus sp. DC10W]|uniref:M28 family metallopeptidase n=1 Tax=Flectobacillus longus TaxID=2984207 RepID=A0ABT6YHD5_9BACT|nr:M28 family metallopeptidase [Flectobacillus longus]MDI9862987.1 M28 family metallopeptidase [Flectobacillus longus]